MVGEEPTKKALTGFEAQIVSMRIQGMSYRLIAKELSRSATTVLQHAHKPHVAEAIREGCRQVVTLTTERIAELRVLAFDTLAEGMVGGEDHATRIASAREVLKVTEPRKSEVKVDGVGDLIRAAVREMSDEELGVCDD